MRRGKYGLLAAAVAAATLAVPFGVSEAAIPGGKWVQDSHGYWYDLGNNEYAAKEFVDGYWIRKNGYWDGDNNRYSWHKDSKGWWYGQDGKGAWYAKSSWFKIDGKWYFFHSDGYLATREYIKGTWVDKNGVASEVYTEGRWLHGAGENSSKWWYRDGSWYPQNQWLKVDGYWYFFDEDGWMLAWKVAKINNQYYGFGGSGRLGNITEFILAEKVSGSITFDFSEGGDRNEAAVDMDMFLSLSLEAGTTKNVVVNGKAKTLSIREVEGVPVVYIDEEKLIDYVANSVSPSVTVEGTGSLSKLMAAFDASGLGGGQNYDFCVKVGNMDFDKFGMSDGYVNFTCNGTNYQALYDGEADGKPVLVFLSNLVDSYPFGVDLAQANLLEKEIDVNAIVTNTATGAEKTYNVYDRIEN